MAKLILLKPKVCTFGLFFKRTYTEFVSKALMVNLQLVIVQSSCNDVWNQLWNQFQDLIRSLICKPDE